MIERVDHHYYQFALITQSTSHGRLTIDCVENKEDLDRMISTLFKLNSHRWNRVAGTPDLTFSKIQNSAIFSSSSESVFPGKKVRWCNQCDQVLLWQLALVLIGAVHNTGTGKMAPSQKHICHQKRPQSQMLQCAVFHNEQQFARLLTTST